MKDDVRKAKAITAMFTAFGQGNEAERIVVYVRMLKDMDAEVLDKVCEKAVYESKFLPTISELITMAKNLVGDATGTEMLSWADAWKEIEHQTQTTFIYGKPEFTRPEIEMAVKSFGWKDLCESPSKDMQIVRAQLRDMYNAICERQKEKSLNAYILGAGGLLDRADIKQIGGK